MGLFDKLTAIDALEGLLARERAAILKGRFDALEHLTQEKQRLIGVVGRSRGRPAQLDRLRLGAERNKALLGAMQAGVKAALQRIESLRATPAPLLTYTASGQSQTLDAPTSQIWHRA